MINESTLRGWASAPVATKYKHTYSEVKKAIEKYLPSIAQKNNNTQISTLDIDIYLQGSYANNTNITGESDVDIVIELKKILFSYDIDDLTTEEKNAFHEAYPSTSTYSFLKFKNDAYQALKSYFEAVSYEAKCLKVPSNSSRVNADIVPSFEHRKYQRFTFYTRDKYIPGIKFYDTEENRKIINYPKKHLENCESKNIDSGGKFKDSVRIFKNFNRELIERNLINDEIAPSYFIENTIYNCSSQVFDGNYTEIVLKIFQFLVNDIENGRLPHYQCANEQDLLFDTNTWNEANAHIFISKAIKLFMEQI